MYPIMPGSVKFLSEESKDKHMCKGACYSIDSELYHQVDSDGIKKYVCPHCQLDYNSDTELVSHVVKHGQSLPCDICRR